MNQNKLQWVDERRVQISLSLHESQKVKHGQYFTPMSIARFMSGMFEHVADNHIKLLDPGAGIGVLASAFSLCWQDTAKSIDILACEIDITLLDDLYETFKMLDCNQYEVIHGDFLEEFKNLQSQQLFSHIILNPPYKKINNISEEKILLKSYGIDTINLYSAFIIMSLMLLQEGGELVAIIPRSFCNGVYYQPFREYLLQNSVIKKIHVFHSRKNVFTEEQILQENIIIHLEKTKNQGNVVVTTSSTQEFEDLKIEEYSFENIVSVEDPNLFIHIPNTNHQNKKQLLFNEDFNNLGINVSTGPVVEFRSREYLYPEGKVGFEFSPLLYPAHFNEENFTIKWPLENFKKYNTIEVKDSTVNQLYETGYYCVVKRFSSKEEKKRIVACVVDPENFDNFSRVIGFENHLNVFHIKKAGLSKEVAYGLMVYLNSTFVDNCFREFSGHTQVNVRDLKYIKYPEIAILWDLGVWAIAQSGFLCQSVIDEKIAEMG